MAGPKDAVDLLAQSGLAIRREVVGADYVDRSLAEANAFSMEIQKLTMAWGWGYAWSDERLDRKTRSLLTIALLTALDRPSELEHHTAGALTNGATVDEIQAALAHATVYCGLPAGLSAFRAANAALLEAGVVQPAEEAAPIA
ncbi:carboxymuconolactone decarboxylase family protein [Rhizorhabdus sp.]|jgi:4-carboxymuconolactone decarboxylase|uniref:carboxymuconolactone decarboxylase family protein n=1 Tax=Rhizorhabdus sp. TaxID=1968843 RepID=UPI0011FE76FA|nr:carboxymuconolactone decarboxylase family protein [Rhizorhabdus sp.]MBD3759654.1 carboxymuconolactone decarboxylase family protein [Rhizorhabdus sp.]TAK16769.1 MAG: gamma carboxymuconolactone decarboxylase [Rhizorhabdus sp.]